MNLGRANYNSSNSRSNYDHNHRLQRTASAAVLSTNMKRHKHSNSSGTNNIHNRKRIHLTNIRTSNNTLMARERVQDTAMQNFVGIKTVIVAGIIFATRCIYYFLLGFRVMYSSLDELV